jgi:hypothetical protein
MGLSVTLIQFRAGTHHPQPLQNMNYSGRGNPPVVCPAWLKVFFGFSVSAKRCINAQELGRSPLADKPQNDA